MSKKKLVLNPISLPKEIKEAWFSGVDRVYKLAQKNGAEKWCTHINSRESLLEYTKYIPLLKVFAKNAKILDWGAQFGHISLLLKELGFNPYPYIIEDSHYSTKICLKDQFPRNYRIGKSGWQLPFESNSFDGIISSGVFEHVNENNGDPYKSLEEIYRILKPGGYFITWKLPNCSGFCEIKSDIFRTWSHETRYTLRGYKRLLESKGFEIELIGLEGFLPSGLTKLLRKNFIFTWIEKFINYLITKHPFSIFANDIYCIAKKQNDF